MTPNIALSIIALIFDIIFFYLIFLVIRGIFRFFKRLFSSNKNAFALSEAVYAPTTVIPVAQEESISGKYALRQSLLTPAEKNFLTVLQRVVGDLYHIELQVQLSRIVAPLDSRANFTNYRDFNRIKAKSIDFVLFDKDYKPYLCIELDDRSHWRFDRAQRDRFVDRVMKDVGLRILHVPTAYSYDAEKLMKQIFSI